MFFLDATAWTLENMIIRITAAFVLGALIGIDRGAKRRGGGARTDAAVCVGAAIVMMTGQYMEIRYPGASDMARMASQVVSGVGFLGAGSILVTGHQVKGLTSAAGIWICACVGLAAGIGFLDGAVLATAILLGGLHILPWVEEKVYQHSRYVILYIEAVEGGVTTELLRRFRDDGCKVDVFEVDRSGLEMRSVAISTTIRIPAGMNKEEYVDSLMEIIGVLSIDSM